MLYVVARERPDLYLFLREEFAEEAEVLVRLDQRRAERRKEAHATVGERRCSERRARREDDHDLRSLGWILVGAG